MVLTAVNVKTAVLWKVTLCDLGDTASHPKFVVLSKIISLTLKFRDD
jgi:hypothetical protein